MKKVFIIIFSVSWITPTKIEKSKKIVFGRTQCIPDDYDTSIGNGFTPDGVVTGKVVRIVDNFQESPPTRTFFIEVENAISHKEVLYVKRTMGEYHWELWPSITASMFLPFG